MAGRSDTILTAAQTRAAERVLFDAGTDPAALMERAGVAAAEIIAARLPVQPVLAACGPGNNGGDGYVVARILAARGWPVRVLALGAPATPQAAAMCARWAGPVAPLDPDVPADALVIDALFGIGARPLDPALTAWLDAARVVAIDQPGGLDTDTGAAHGRARPALLTVALGAWKPVHAVMPGVHLCGALALAPIGLPLPAEPALVRLTRPALRGPDATSHKYNRGKVVVVAGAMAGAAELAAHAAQRSGAGYVELAGGAPSGHPLALVRRAWGDDALADPRIGAVAIGPGLTGKAGDRVAAALASNHPLVLDAGALAHLPAGCLPGPGPHVLTPHAGEFARLFGDPGDDPLSAVRAAAATTGAIVVQKGAATIVAAPDGRCAVAPIASPWLATAGTGDVLAGICATMLAQAAWHGLDAFAAVGAAVWLHARAAALAGPALIADDLVPALRTALAECIAGG